ncbi:MAG TPA: hypothetical protein VIH42_09705 [Thermoguttaceae bacterium]
MSACPHNIDLKALLQHETETGRFASPRSSSTFTPKQCPECDLWRVVDADGSTSSLKSKCESEASGSTQSNRDESQDQATTLDDYFEELLNPPDFGVDVSYLNVEEETSSKMITGLHAAVAGLPSISSGRQIAMSSAVTDLQEMFKIDEICMVIQSRSEDTSVKSAPSNCTCMPCASATPANSKPR